MYVTARPIDMRYRTDNQVAEKKRQSQHDDKIFISMPVVELPITAEAFN